MPVSVVGTRLLTRVSKHDCLMLWIWHFREKGRYHSEAFSVRTLHWTQCLGVVFNVYPYLSLLFFCLLVSLKFLQFVEL